MEMQAQAKQQETVEISFTQNVKVTMEQIKNMLVGALEGGSNYWYWISKINPPKNLDRHDAHNNIYNAAMNDGGSLVFVDKDDIKTDFFFGKAILDKNGDVIPKDDDIEEFVLDWNKIVNGLKLMAKKASNDFKNMIDGNDDEITADVFLQYCLFGKLIYG